MTVLVNEIVYTLHRFRGFTISAVKVWICQSKPNRIRLGVSRISLTITGYSNFLLWDSHWK